MTTTLHSDDQSTTMTMPTQKDDGGDHADLDVLMRCLADLG